MKKSLIVIDAQVEYGPDGALPVVNLQSTLANLKTLIGSARDSSTKIVHVRHISRTPGDSSFDAGSRGVEFLPGIGPSDDDFILTKQFPSAFTNPLFDRYLSRNGIDALFICGYTSMLCCDSTSREAFQLGYQVFYVDDAISEFDLDGLDAPTIHRVISSVQRAAFSKVVSTEEAARLLRVKD